MSKNHFLYTAAGRVFLEDRYVQAKESTHAISERLNRDGIKTNHSLVKRAVKSHSLPYRNRSAAQSAALETSRAPHPTKGKTRAPEVRRQISDSLKARKNNGNSSTPE